MIIYGGNWPGLSLHLSNHFQTLAKCVPCNSAILFFVENDFTKSKLEAIG